MITSGIMIYDEKQMTESVCIIKTSDPLEFDVFIILLL